MKLIDRIRNAEPAWLADKRKAIIPPIAGALVDLLARAGIHLDVAAAGGLALVVTAIVTWAIPNRPPAEFELEGGRAPEITIPP